MWFSPGARAGPILSSLRETVARGGDGHHTCCDTEFGDEFLFPSRPRLPQHRVLATAAGGTVTATVTSSHGVGVTQDPQARHATATPGHSRSFCLLGICTWRLYLLTLWPPCLTAERGDAPAT